jgi:hypothetical protein
MTAFEIADALSQYDKVSLDGVKIADVITILRFQAHEITALLEQINELQRVL